MTQRVLSVLRGAPHRDTTRTGQNMNDEHMADLIELLQMPETERLMALPDRKARDGRLVALG